MKITKRQLRKIINEEVQNFLNENYMEEIKPGDYLEVFISDDGYERGVRKLDSPAEYQNTKSYAFSFKGLVRVEQVASTEEENY